MPGRRNRQEFSQPFDDAENEGFKEKNRVHGVQPELLASWGGRILLSRSRSRLQIRQPNQGLIPRFTTHFRRCLQTGAAFRAFRAGKNQTAKIRVKMTTRHTRRLG
jgi:hypothetical protein